MSKDVSPAKKQVASLLLAAACLCVPAVDARAQGGGLFTPVDSAAEFVRDAPVQPGEVTGDVTTLRRRSVRIDMERLAAAQANAAGEGAAPPASLTLNLFDDVVFPACVTGTEPTSSGGYSLAGRLDGVAFGSLVLVVNGDVVAGTVQAPPDTYTIRSDRATASTSFARSICRRCPRRSEPVNIPAPEAGRPAPAAGETAPTAPGAGDTAGPSTRLDCRSAASRAATTVSVIDVLVVYTSGGDVVRGRHGAEIEALIDLTVAETNQAYVDSNVMQRIRLAHKQEIVHEDRRGHRRRLSPGTTAYDGFLDDVHELRDDHHGPTSSR